MTIKNRKKVLDLITIIVLCSILVLLAVGVLWGSYEQLVEGWDKALTNKEKLEIWIDPTLTCLLPAIVLYWVYQLFLKEK
jgi:hypothetical protein